jgi:hypothetical protein
MVWGRIRCLLTDLNKWFSRMVNNFIFGKDKGPLLDDLITFKKPIK